MKVYFRHMVSSAEGTIEVVAQQDIKRYPTNIQVYFICAPQKSIAQNARQGSLSHESFTTPQDFENHGFLNILPMKEHRSG